MKTEKEILERIEEEKADLKKNGNVGYPIGPYVIEALEWVLGAKK